MVATTVFWFRKGLRLHDNPALCEAIRGSSHVVPLFCLDPWFVRSGRVGANRMNFLLEVCHKPLFPPPYSRVHTCTLLPSFLNGSLYAISIIACGKSTRGWSFSKATRVQPFLTLSGSGV